MKKILFAIVLSLASTIAFSQFITPGAKAKPQPVSTEVQSDNNPFSPDKIHVVYGRIDGKDTILIVYLPEIDIDLMGRYYEITETRQGRRLVSNVRKVYPYARLASVKLQEYDTLLASIPKESDRRRMIKQFEEELSDQYTEELKKLTFSQGLILIRLIDRETGNTSYQLVRELHGYLRAFFYQGFARLWGYNLKEKFDPKNNKEDEQIDIIATLLERGQI